MSAPSFTPGPWNVNGMQSVRGPNGEYIARGNWNNGPANARLIAAAPELYAALEMIVEASLIDSAPLELRGIGLAAMMALAKARGES